MAHTKMNRNQGHWILAGMGKKALRPGGKALTLKLIDQLHFTPRDHVTEFAPGLGYTASIVLQNGFASYTGVEQNKEAAALLKEKINGSAGNIIVRNAAKSAIDARSMDKVYGEAMLTMQADHRKAEIMCEAGRILKPGGLYGIHELSLTPNAISDELKSQIQRELAQSIRVNARPITIAEWTGLLEEANFEILSIDVNPMHLLKYKRLKDDEGFFRSLKIIFNVLTHKRERGRINEMRRVFTKYEPHLRAVAIVARKKE